MRDSDGTAHGSPETVRLAARSGQLTGPTCGTAPGYLQANLVVVPEFAADHFARFCELNPRPCPLLEVTGPGETGLARLGRNVDLRTDLPRYRVFERGEVIEEPLDVAARWRKDLVSFLLGCSFSFEEAMLEAGLPVRHIEEGRNVPMYRTSIDCAPAGPFCGGMVVSMRPLRPEQVSAVTQLCSDYPFAHGEPVHAGDPEAIGVGDLERPDFGEAVTLAPGEVPVFWACGVTPQEVLRAAKLDLAITHSPGCMFVSDLTARDWMESSRREGKSPPR